MKVIVVIPAAGLGTRMAAGRGGRKPAVSKQFTQIGGLPILEHTLRRFAENPQVTDIYVALRKNEIRKFGDGLDPELKKKLTLVEGGDTRQDSVAAALAQVQARGEDIVLVHDAVRPFVDDEIIRNVIEGVLKHGAVIAGVPAVDTIKQVERTADGAIVIATVPRERVVQAQTPQGARYSLIKRAFEEAQADGFQGTDEASLIERLGHVVHVVMGSPENIKITTPGDLELAEFYVNRRRASLTR